MKDTDCSGVLWYYDMSGMCSFGAACSYWLLLFIVDIFTIIA